MYEDKMKLLSSFTASFRVTFPLNFKIGGFVNINWDNPSLNRILKPETSYGERN